jgi:DNA end-binding protein Ku
MSMPSLPPAGAARGRPSWSGLLRLSLVAVPVQAYPAALSTEETHLYQLHAGCGLRVRHEKHCPAHGKIDAGAVARGYAYAPSRYVVLDEAELAQLRPARDQALVLEHFLDPAQLDPALFSGRTLYLLPDGPAAQHPYRVLAQAMRRHARWGVGRVVLGGHRHVALVRPAGRVLACHVLHHPGQLRPAAACEAGLRDGPVGEDEARLAGLLVEAASTQALPWSAYRDDTADRLAALAEAKLQGRPLPADTPEEPPVLHLLDALRQSVAEARQRHEDPRPGAPPAPESRTRTPRRSA